MPRTIAVGDIHGCADALRTIVKLIKPQKDDTIVTLGDYVDRGPDSCDVIEQLIDLSRQCQLVALRGNHEQMMLDGCKRTSDFPLWIINGGDTTMKSYGERDPRRLPKRHMQFLKATPLYHETQTHLFVHANYDEHKPMELQDPEVMIWRRLDDCMPGRHCSGKVAFVGHTIIYDDPFDLGHLVCIDTGCFAGGALTAMDVNSREIWQVNMNGVACD
jgi:serine/threonine protein phosphatase 1